MDKKEGRERDGERILVHEEEETNLLSCVGL